MKRHYQIVIVACCFLIMFVNQGLPSTSFNVWQSYLVKVPDVGNAGVTAVLLTRTAVSFLSIFVVTQYYRLLDLRYGVALATLFTAGGFFMYGIAGHSIVLYCAGSVLSGIGYGVGGVVATTTLIGNWFKGDLGTAAGIAGVGSGAAGMLIPLVAARLIDAFGLSVAFFCVSGAAVVLGVVVFAFVRSTPAKMGMQPFVVAKKAARRGELARKEAAAQRFEHPEPISRAHRALMLVAMALLGADAISASSYFSVTLSTSGIGLMEAANITALMGASLALAKFLSGKLFDIIGTFQASALFFLALIAGAGFCAAVSWGGVACAIGAAVLFGAGCALSTTGLSVWALELSSPKDEMDSVRDFMIAYAFGGFLFNIPPGILHSVTGTYETSFVLFAVGSVVCMVLVLYVLRARERAAKAGAGAAVGEGASGHAGADVKASANAKTSTNMGTKANANMGTKAK